jgi:hypothetical protein
VISIIRPKIPGAQDGLVKDRCNVTSAVVKQFVGEVSLLVVMLNGFIFY